MVGFGIHRTVGVGVKRRLATFKVFSLNRAYKYSLCQTAMAYGDLAAQLAQSSYAQFKSDVKEQGIFALFADPDKLYPFPFIFSLSLSMNQYFKIPDDYAAVYVNGTRNYDVTQDNLVCQFSGAIGDNSLVTVISDYCLRLCIDPMQGPKAVVQIWTNIPNGSYITTDSAAILLSLDGVTFKRAIKLTSDTLYIQGSMPEAEYGVNISNIAFKLLSCEVLSVSTD